ncbi:SulP family inorganic anion transporter [Vibrio vulnificus]|uniref:SulP family inorganic anion transporter n=1 Tax=Vibrio vulnificus TaxID=672 RepID=UPI0015FDA330|nr:SulP family inorganic anion transporter [Vibrio vulnificus]EHU5195947.1 SulP family inorganic anion transporter [Vibrio vulnificus]EJT0552380.1 SulP family inorganic anion transporter [Vibrio vulnificus]EJV9311096.1 SulP family inorganic anion transporter [Vibrio vulnificus]ELJ0841850.1 SulP family inorganic anion transporter [Vibrio vulnificus]ELV8589098.1 SulP family inorganic anion transporter [Vibrio vulnificus]
MRAVKHRQLSLLFPFLKWLPKVNAQSLQADFWAGLTGAIIVLPQGIAYAMIAGLPAEFGLYTAIIPAILASLFGSSHHLISGPTAALSVIVFTTVSQFAEPSTPLYIQLCFTLTLCAGVIQLLFGLLRFGAVVNFVSHSVVLGFTAGAAIVIGVSQLKHVLGLQYNSGETAIENLLLLGSHVVHFNAKELSVGMVTILVCVLCKRIWPKLPHMLLATLASMAFALWMNHAGYPVLMVSEVSSRSLSLSSPFAGLSHVEPMLGGIVAVAMLGLVEAISISRSVALKSRQSLDSNQEFVGQGFSNIVGSFFSCYVSSGSFTRSGVNYSSGAKTPLAAVFAALLLLVIMLLFAPYAAYIPIAGMGGLLLVVAWHLVDVHHITTIVKHDKKEAVVLVVTCLAALFLHLELSIYVGVGASLFFYLRKTSRPAIERLSHDELNLEQQDDIAVIRINGSIFFGCVQYLHQEMQNVSAKHLIILGRGINFIDHLGVQMLEDYVSTSGRTVYFCRFKANAKASLLKGASSVREEHFSERLTPLLNQICKRSL